MGYYRSNDPTNSVKALKENRVQKLGFNPIKSTPLSYNDVTNMQY